MENIKSNIFLEAPKSNDPPSARELQLVETMHRFSTTRIEELEQDDAKIIVEMSSARAQRDALNAKLVSLEDRKTNNAAAMKGHISNVEVYDTIRAPIRRVPLDILREIAWHALPDHPSFANSQVPVSLSHVSQAWRCVVLSMPRMWTTLYVPLVSTENRRYSRSAAGIISFFERSKSLPLSLTVAFGDGPKPAYVSRFFTATQKLFPQVQTLAISAGSVFTPLQSLRGSYNWEHLQSLTFINTNGGYHPFASTEEEHRVGKVFQNAPRLREVIIDQDFATYNAALNLLPWDQVQTLTLSEWLTPETWISLMARCPNLTSGRFIMEDSSSPGPVLHHHHHLQELFVTFYSCPDTAIHLFDQTYFPNLRTLRLGRLEGLIDELPVSAPSSYLQFRTLHTLSLWGDLIYPIAELKALLHETNALTSLELVVSTSFNALVEAITPARGTIQYLPYLTNLAIEIYTTDLINQDKILTLVRGRCDQISGCARLETFVIAFPDDQQLRESMVGVFTAHQTELKDLCWEVVRNLSTLEDWHDFSTLDHSLWTYPGKDDEDL